MPTLGPIRIEYSAKPLYKYHYIHIIYTFVFGMTLWHVNMVFPALNHFYTNIFMFYVVMRA
uniref:Uncharacterized protein n=1 Tax=Anguilla anguilla TaxID=7936 RepID=A0A0E9SFP6_ANGAN